MATVPELKTMAKSLGITGYSRMTKPELEHVIGSKTAENQERYGRSGLHAESASNEINSADPTPTPTEAVSKAERARRAGTRGVSAQPLDNDRRELNYWNQYVGHSGREGYKVTPAQSRRMRRKAHKLSGFSGCTLADYREMRRRMKRAGMIPADQR